MRGLLILGLGGVLLAGAVPAQDIEAGRKVAGMCRTCHGLDGLAQIPIAPSIGGEPASYIAAQLEAFRSGAPSRR
jgi:cytochrome c553